jgi:cytochrome c biogenesis protein CcmG/thiol:disulfide interchange protein DsbE
MALADPYDETERRMMRITGFFLALLLFVATPSCSSDTPPDDKGNSAPNFALTTVEGRTIELKELEGSVVVINFWATWCAPCRAEIPGMLEVYDKYRGEGLEIVGIALDRGGWNVVTPFVEKMKINYPIVLGGGEIVQKYGGISAIPTTFIVDKKGNVVKGHVGYLSKDDLEKIVSKLL